MANSDGDDLLTQVLEMKQQRLLEKFNVVRSVGVECFRGDELMNLLKNKPKPEPVCYVAFQPSGRMDNARADICLLGVDQRKVTMLARKYCDYIKSKNKPIMLSHHMLMGLQQGQEKMSKSDSSSEIYMDDEEAEVNVKIKKAYCPPQTVEGNPCLEYLNYMIFPWFKEFTVERKAENGGNKTYQSYDELVAEYASGTLHHQ